MVQIGREVSEKILFEFLYVHDLGSRSRNDLDLQYSHIFIYLIGCLLLLTFRSLPATVSEKSTVFTFSYSLARRFWRRRFVKGVLRNYLRVRLSPIKSPVLCKYLNPFKRPIMYPSISKCNAKSCNCCQHLCTNTTITSSVNGRTFSVINNSDLD